MKNRLLLSLFILSFAIHAKAYNPNAPECKVIKLACDDAGYKPGGFLKGYKKPKKAPAIDCLKTIVDGGKVDNVSVSEITVAACKKTKGTSSAATVKTAPPAKNDIKQNDAKSKKKK